MQQDSEHGHSHVLLLQCLNYWLSLVSFLHMKLPTPPTIKAPSSIPNKTQISHPVTNMNKLLCVVVPCILTLALYISIYSLYSPALSTSDQLFGRKLLGEHRVPTSEPAGEQKLEVSEIVRSFRCLCLISQFLSKIKRIFNWVQNLEAKQSFIGEEHDDRDGEGLILNADYHGVTTHPSPLPKHPRP